MFKTLSSSANSPQIFTREHIPHVGDVLLRPQFVLCSRVTTNPLFWRRPKQCIPYLINEIRKIIVLKYSYKNKIKIIRVMISIHGTGFFFYLTILLELQNILIGSWMEVGAKSYHHQPVEQLTAKGAFRRQDLGLGHC